MALQVENLSKSYATPTGVLNVLQGVDFALEQGATCALTGESGSGKSTLLHLIGALDRPDDGKIELNGERIDRFSDKEAARFRRDKVGLVFQQFNLVPSVTVSSNIRLQARLAQREDRRWTAEIAERLGVADLLDRYPEQLSGGQQQRVAIARAFASRPELILADEPTGNLDEAASDRVLSLTLDLAVSSRTAFLVVTHSDRVADQLGRRVRLHAGRIE